MGRPNTATKHHAPSRRPKPHEPGGPLDAIERDQAVEHSSLRAMVIHEVLREEGETELKREPAALAWSGLAAGLSMGFSFLGLALVHSALPEAPWTRLVDSIGYTVGFLITILGRQALFTESTLTAVLPVLVRRDRDTLRATIKFWLVVLSCNLVGTMLIAAFISINGLFPDEVHRSLMSFAHDGMSGAFWPTFFKAILAGWLIAVMAVSYTHLLLHHLAELTGQDQLAGAFDAARLDEQNVASRGGPRQSGGHPGNAGALRHVVLEARRSQNRLDVAGIDRHGGRGAGGDGDGGVAQQRADLPLQAAYARLAGVVEDLSLIHICGFQVLVARS